MLHFECDYNVGAHEKIMERLAETNLEKTPGYGADKYCESAARKIQKACGCRNGQVYFLVGGTQTNAVVIRTMLADYEGVLAADTGHIGVHEAGAVEFTGHKVLTLSNHAGKINAKELEACLKAFYEDGNHEHMVFPGMVYLSHPTEYGTLYTKAELQEISDICRAYQILLYLDGARLGYGLAAPDTDVTLPLLAKLCDAFYIGGTKVGALCGEAVVFPNGNAPAHFLTMVKQQGAMLAKGWLLGLQFDTLFTDDLYLTISRHAIRMAMRMKEGMQKLGCRFLLDSPTNQQFLILENEKIERLKEKVTFSFWENVDGEHTAVRFAVSWATTEEEVEELLKALAE